jgi:hypothetical protein
MDADEIDRFITSRQWRALQETLNARASLYIADMYRRRLDWETYIEKQARVDELLWMINLPLLLRENLGQTRKSGGEPDA